ARPALLVSKPLTLISRLFGAPRSLNARRRMGGSTFPTLPHITIVSLPPIFRLKVKLYHRPSLQTPTILCERRQLDSRTHPSFRCPHHRDSGLHNENSTLP